MVVTLLCGPVCVGLWFNHVSSHNLDVIEPLHAVTGILAVGFWGYLLWLPDASITASGDPDKALMLTCLGTLSFLAGYSAPIGARLAQRLPVPATFQGNINRLGGTVLLVSWAVTALFRLWFSFPRGYGMALMHPSDAGSSLDNIVQLIGRSGRYLALMLVVLALSKAGRTNRILLGMAMASVVAEAWLSSLSGWKSGPIVILVMVVLIIRMMKKHRRRVIHIMVVGGAVAALVTLFVFDALDNYRAQSSRQSLDSGSLAAIFQSWDISGLSTRTDRLYRRIGYGAILGDVIGAEDSGTVERANGQTLWPGFVWFIPRSVWPGKPVLSIGAWYANRVLGWAYQESEAAVTLPGDFYLNFGTPGVIAGMLLYGLFLRGAYEYLSHRFSPTAGLWLLLPIFMTFGLTIERNLSAMVGEASETLVVVVAYTWLLHHGKRRPQFHGAHGVAHQATMASETTRAA